VVYLEDPAWSSEPAVRHLVFVAMSILEMKNGRRVILPSRLWWLSMNEDGDTIVAAGPLTESEPDLRSNGLRFERMPNVAVGAGGKISLAYLARGSRENAWQIRSATLEMDPATNRPRIKNGSAATSAVADGLAPASLVVSASGENVYGISASGQTVKHALPR
jgi:hypothetical protein